MILLGKKYKIKRNDFDTIIWIIQSSTVVSSDYNSSDLLLYFFNFKNQYSIKNYLLNI